MYLLAERFDNDPFMEFAEISGYGFWGEGHHFAAYDGPNGRSYDKIPDNAEEAVDRTVNIHLDAFKNTPAVMNVHLTHYEAGMKHLRDSGVWIRRDSFYPTLSTHEWKNITSVKDGQAMLWEALMPNMSTRSGAPVMGDMSLVHHYVDSGASYSSLGFNAWYAQLLHQHCVDQIKYLAENLGYKLRPSITWRRYTSEEEQEIVMVIINDGCAAPAGQLTFTVTFPSGAVVETALPKGQPAPGTKPLVCFKVPDKDLRCTAEDMLQVCMRIKLKGKSYPVRWATKQVLDDPHVIILPMYVEDDARNEIMLPNTNASGYYIYRDEKGNPAGKPKRREIYD